MKLQKNWLCSVKKDVDFGPTLPNYANYSIKKLPIPITILWPKFHDQMIYY